MQSLNEFPLYIVVYFLFTNNSWQEKLTGFGNFGIAQGQANDTSELTPEQKDAICNPNNPASKLNPVNTTESRICGIPKTVKLHLSNMTSANTTTTGAEAPPTNLAPSAAPPPGE
jgi:hypothetical protein